VAAALRTVDGIHGAVAPSAVAPSAVAPSAVAPSAGDWRRGGTALVEAVPVADSGSDAGSATLARVREAAHAVGPGVHAGGQPADNADFIDTVYGDFPLLIALIAITTLILLARAFRSLLLPLKAILLNILSIAAVWGGWCWCGSTVTAPRRCGVSARPVRSVLVAADGVRLSVRPLDGVRGVHPLPDPRRVRPQRLRRERRRRRHRRTGRLVTCAA
jgi:hypothetical protein